MRTMHNALCLCKANISRGDFFRQFKYTSKVLEKSSHEGNVGLFKLERIFCLFWKTNKRRKEELNNMCCATYVAKEKRWIKLTASSSSITSPASASQYEWCLPSVPPPPCIIWMPPQFKKRTPVSYEYHPNLKNFTPVSYDSSCHPDTFEWISTENSKFRNPNILKSMN